MDALPTDIAALAAAVAAAAAIWLGVLTLRQVRLSQSLIHNELEARLDQQRPVLIPNGSLSSAITVNPSGTGPGQTNLVIGYDFSARSVHVSIINAGPGIAFNVEGVIFGPEPSTPTPLPPAVHSAQLPFPLLATQGINPLSFERGGTSIVGTDRIGGYLLYAPKEPTQLQARSGHHRYLIRLTLTYTDLFGRKHASIFDYRQDNTWVYIATPNAITENLHDLHVAHLQKLMPSPPPAPSTDQMPTSF